MVTDSYGKTPQELQESLLKGDKTAEEIISDGVESLEDKNYDKASVYLEVIESYSSNVGEIREYLEKNQEEIQNALENSLKDKEAPAEVSKYLRSIAGNYDIPLLEERKKDRDKDLKRDYKVKDIRSQHWYKLKEWWKSVPQAAITRICREIPSPKAKVPLYRMIGVDIADDAVISPDVQMEPFRPEKISIGGNTTIGWGAMIVTHEFVDDRVRIGEVNIGDNVTVGARTTVLPGVTIEDNAIVGAHSLVNRNVREGEIVGGVDIETIGWKD